MPLSMQSADLGDYFFFRWTGNVDRLHVSSKFPFIMPFSVTQSEVVYIGEIFLEVEDCGSSKGRYRIVVRDQSDRDLDLFDKQMEYFDSEDVQKRIIDPPSNWIIIKET